MHAEQLKTRLRDGAFQETFRYLYGGLAEEQPARYQALAQKFQDMFGGEREALLFSAPGRTEVGGNHTDHQHGCVLAAGVNMDVIAMASKNGDRRVRIHSEGYPIDEVCLEDLEAHPEERNQTAALIRGVAARFAQLGLPIGGFDACLTSSVLKGSGLSSSAAFETLIGVMFNTFYADGAATPVQIAQIGQYAENVYFGKPCGLMDQTACAVGGFVRIDFADPQAPVVDQVRFAFEQSGYRLCIVDTGGNHADLTEDYASAPIEMCAVARAMGKPVLREVEPEAFYRELAHLRTVCGDRALLRAVHFFEDNARVAKQAAALRTGDFETFKRLVIESGESSFMYLQNVFTCKNPAEQGLSLGLAVSARLLKGRGAWRVHGGGFAGTIQCFVPDDLLAEYKRSLEAVFGAGSCHVLSIRPVGGVQVTEQMGA